MGWKRKIAGKLGNLLYRPLETPVKLHDLQDRAGPSTESKEAIQDASQELLPNSREAMEQREEFGPDTSSLTAFLLSFLRNSETSDSRTDHGCNLETFEGSRDDLGGASSSEGWVGQNECEVDDFSVGSPQIGCWGNVDKHASKMNKDSELHVPRLGENQSCVIQGRQCNSLMLPAMSENSVLLSDDIRTVIYPALPNLIKGCIWMLLYSTARHGISLHTLYRRSSALPGPVLLVVGDFEGAVFGGLVTSPLKPTSKRKYYGTSEMFVFTNVHANPRYFMATGCMVQVVHVTHLETIAWQMQKSFLLQM
eukprot:c26028_g1_i2 orf=167-1093(+)